MTGRRTHYRKRGRAVPAGYFAWEAAGLAWLGEVHAAGGARVARVVDVAVDHLDLEWLDQVTPTLEAARDFGRRLGRTHAAGASAFGQGPPGHSTGYFGPLSAPLPLVLGSWQSWGEFYAEARIAPMVGLARDRQALDAGAERTLDRVCERLRDGDFDTGEPPARLHGDLWSGNVLWTGAGATLIDPAAHGGHHETDLALLALFGAPHLSELLVGYQVEHPLAPGWQGRVGLHQLHCLLVHAVVFGGGYADQVVVTARRYA